MADKWMLIQDNDCHWYCIPVKVRNLFENMLAESQSDDGRAFNDRFSSHAIGGSPTRVSFENPRW